MKISIAFLTAAIAGSALARHSTLADRVRSRGDGTRRHRIRPLVKVGSAFKDNARSATGRFNVPIIKRVGSGGGNESSAAWVGIGGDTCISGLLQAGVDFTITDSGGFFYDAWYEWYPASAYDFKDFAVSAGDIIQVDITVTSTTKGKVELTNINTGQSVYEILRAPRGSVLCRQNAEWIVEDFEQGGRLVAVSNFETVEFSRASTGLSTGGTEDLSSAIILDIRQDGTIHTDVTINSGSRLTVKYV